MTTEKIQQAISVNQDTATNSCTGSPSLTDLKDSLTIDNFLDCYTIKDVVVLDILDTYLPTLAIVICKELYKFIANKSLTISQIGCQINPRKLLGVINSCDPRRYKHQDIDLLVFYLWGIIKGHAPTHDVPQNYLQKTECNATISKTVRSSNALFLQWKNIQLKNR